MSAAQDMLPKHLTTMIMTLCACLKVRKSACNSLGIHTILYAEFARQSLSLLMDMLNDDSMAVRLEALETLHHMATFECLHVQEIHMHMVSFPVLIYKSRINIAFGRIFRCSITSVHFDEDKKSFL